MTQQTTERLVSLIEIASELGVKRNTVDQWRWRGLLPEADFDLAVGPVWRWDTIRSWAIDTGRLEA